MDYLSKASILLCCCFLLFADGQYAAKRFGRKGNDDTSKSGPPDYLSGEYSSKSNQETITPTKQKSTESQINVVSGVQLQENSLQNGISLPRRQGRRSVAFGSRLSGSTNNSSATTIRPHVNGVKSQIRSSSTEKPGSVDFLKTKESGSRRKTFNKLNSQAEDIKAKEQLSIKSDTFKNEKEVTASTEESLSTLYSYESGKATYETSRRFTTKRGITRQSKPGFIPSTIAPILIHAKSEILPTTTAEKSLGENQLQGDKFPNNNSLPFSKSSKLFNQIKSRINQQKFNQLNPASNTELLKTESGASKIFSNKNGEIVAKENPNDSALSSLQKRKITRFTKRPFNKLNSNLQNIFPTKSTHGLSSDFISEEQNESYQEDSFKSLKQESEASEKFNNKNDEGVSEEKTNEHTSLNLPRRKTTRLTKRPFNKLNSNLENLPASKSSDELSKDYINEDQNVSQLEGSSEHPSLFSQTESLEKATELSEKDKKEEPVKINEDLNTSFSSNKLKGIRFTRRPSSKLNRTREVTISAKPIRGTNMSTDKPASRKKEDEPEKTILIKPPQWPQTESLELDSENTFHSENIEETQVTPFLPNQRKGNKRKPADKLSSNQQNLRITNSNRNTDISEVIIQSQEQFSNHKFDPIKPTQWSQTESMETYTDGIVLSENTKDTQPAAPFLSNRKRGNKRRPSHKLSSHQQDLRITNRKPTTDIREDVIKSHQQYSNLQFDPIKPPQWPQAESLELNRDGSVDSENVEDLQPATPILSNWKNGNKRRPSQKLNRDQQDSRITNPKTTTDINEDVIKSQQQYSNLQFDAIKPAQWPQAESLELNRDGSFDSENVEDLQPATPILSNWKNGNKRRPSQKLNRDQQDSRITNLKTTTDISEDVIKSQQQYSNLQYDPIRPPQWPQAESLELNRDGSFDSENVEDLQPATPILSNWKNGNKRRPSQKLNRNQQDSRITNPKTTTDISEDVIKSQQQYSNLQYDPIRPPQWPQAESLELNKDGSFDSENVEDLQPATPILSNWKNGNKRRPSQKLNRDQQGSRITNLKTTTDISEDVITSQQQYSNLQFDPLKPAQWPQAESLELNRDGSVDSENVEDLQPATPILSNWKNGNKRRPSQKLNRDQQDSRITNLKTTTDISEDVIKSQQQYSNLQFDPLKPLQFSQKELVGKSTKESIDFFGNRQETPFISNRYRGNKNTKRPSNQLNRPRQNAVRTNPAQRFPSVSDIKSLIRFEDSLEDLSFKPPQIMTNETPKRITEKMDGFFSHRDVVPFHSYRQRGSKNTRRPEDKKSVPTTRRRMEITEKPHVLQANNYQQRFPYPNADLRPRRPSDKLNSDHQSGAEISVLNSKTDATRFQKPEMTLPSRDSTPFIPSQYNHQPYFYPTGYSINKNERFEMYPTSLSSITYNSRHTGRTAGPLTEVNNSDILQSYDRTQNMFKNFNNTKTTHTSRRPTPSGKYTEEDLTEGSGSTETIYEAKEVVTISAEEHSPFFATYPPPSSKHDSPSVNESNISKDTDGNFVSSSATEATPNYQQEFTLERIQPILQPVPTSSPEERISESLYYKANYSSESDLASHPNSYGLSHFPENTQTSSDYFSHELYYTQITERPTFSLETKYTFPSNSLSTVTELSTTTEPIKQQQGKIQVIKQDFNHSTTNYDEFPIGTSTATNESVIFLQNMKQKSPSQAFTSVSVKYPSFSKNEQAELKNTLALSKPFISSPLSTIFDTSSENGQYYHYVMNLGQKPPTSKGIAKTKVYSSGNALYTILHEDELNSHFIPKGYGTSASKNASESSDKAMYPEFIDQYQTNNLKSIGSSNPHFESEGNVLNLIYNATSLLQNSPNKTDNDLNEANIASISHTLIQEANFTEIYPLVELTTQPIQAKFLSSNVKSEINSTSSFLEGIFDNESRNQTGQKEPSTTRSFLANIFETVSETNESLNQSSFPEITKASTFAIFGNHSFQNRSLIPNQFQGTETTQNYSETENALSYITVTETSADVPSTSDYLGHLDKTILQRIYLLAKRNGSVSFGNVSYKFDLNKLLSILNENASVPLLTTESRHETTSAPLFYDGFTETSTSLPVTTENSRSHTPLYSEDNISDIENIAESINENALPLSNLYIVHEGSDLENTAPITESTTSLPMISSSPTNNLQFSFDSSKVRTMDRVILPDLLEVTENSNIGDDASKDLPSHPMLELVIKNSSVDDFISKINRVPVVIRVFNPISKSYHSVLITPESKSNEEMNFVDTEKHGNILHSNESLDSNSITSDSEIIKEDVKLITDSEERSSDADQSSNAGVYFDTISPNESYTDNIPNITSTEIDDTLTSASPSQPERKLISIDELKELLMKSVEQSVNLPPYSTTLDEAKSVHNFPDMDKEQGINDKFPMLAKQSRFPIEMNNISPEDISISISESVVINSQLESDTSAETQDIYKNEQIPPVKSEPRETEMNMSMLKNVDDPIKMVLSIMETYKPPKEATMWKDEAPSTGESLLESPLHVDSQITNMQSSDERKTDNDETPFIVSLQTESPMGFGSLYTENYQLSKENSAKDDETPFVVPLKVESHGNINHPSDDNPLHLIPIYFKGDEYETPAESQRVYEFQKINGDLKRIYPHSKIYNNGLSRPSHPSQKIDKVSHKANHAEFPFAESNSNTNHRHNVELGYAAKAHSVQDYGTYLQYSRIGSLYDRKVQNSMTKSHSRVTSGFPQPSIPSSSSDILPEDSDESQMFSWKDSKEVDVKKSQNLHSGNFKQLQESGALPEILVEGESNNYQEITDMNTDDTVDVPVLEYPFRDVPQHSDKRTSIYTSFQKDDKNDYRSEISRTDRLKNSSEQNGKSYYRTLPQYISPEITTIDSVRDNRQISYQASDNSTIQKKSSTSDIQKLNSKDLLQHTTSGTRLQKSSSNWDDTESTVKYVKAIPYVEPKRNKYAVTDSENSTSDQFILLEDTDVTVDKPNSQSRRDALKTGDKISNVIIKSELPLNDENDYLYPVFKTDRSKHERSLSD